MELTDLDGYDFAKFINELNEDLQDYGKVLGIKPHYEDDVVKYYIIFEDKSDNSMYEFFFGETGKVHQSSVLSAHEKNDKLAEYESNGGVTQNTIKSEISKREYSNVWVSFYEGAETMTYASAKNIKLPGLEPTEQWDITNYDMSSTDTPWIFLKDLGSGITIVDSTYTNKIKKVVVLDEINPKDTDALFTHFNYCETFEGLEKINYSYCKKIGDDQFSGCNKLTSIVIPDGVTKIGSFAFSSCLELSDITIPSTVTTIGQASFVACKKLTNINLPNSIKEIETNAFAYSGLKEIEIPENVTSIGAFAFEGATSLKTVRLNAKEARCTVVYKNTSSGSTVNPPFPSTVNNIIIGNSVENITGFVFMGTSISSLSIPSSVKNIETYAFTSCSQLTTVTGGENVEKIGPYAFSKTGLTSFNFGSSLKEIGMCAFGWTSLTQVTLSDSVTTLGDYAFCSNESLKSFKFGKGLTTTGKYLLKWCPELITIDLGPNLQEIGIELCYENASLTTVTGGDSLKYIGERAFTKCTSLSNFNFGAYLETIGSGAFGYTALTQLDLGGPLKTIDDMAFYSCTQLQSVTIPAFVTKIGQASFSDCPNISVINYEAMYASETDLSKGTFDGVYPAFMNSGTSNLTINIREGALTIPNYLFWSCTAKYVNITSGIMLIGQQSFQGCPIENITIPSSISYISQYAFYNCASLKTVTVNLAENSIAGAPWTNTAGVQVIWNP